MGRQLTKIERKGKKNKVLGTIGGKKKEKRRKNFNTWGDQKVEVAAFGSAVFRH